MPNLGPGVRLFHRVTGPPKESSVSYYRGFIWILTFVTYAAYHASRRPITIVRNSPSFLTCDNARLTGNDSNVDNNTQRIHEELCVSFIDEMDHVDYTTANSYLSAMGETSYLISYAIFMFLSGYLCERMDLRYFLTIGCLLSGGFTFMFGLAYSTGIKSIWYFIILQIIIGAVQTTGWPGVVSVMANWFGKGKRGLIFGIWNAHTSIGNIIGAEMSREFLNERWGYDWGLSFIIPGIFIASVGFLLYLLLIPSPDVVGLHPPQHHQKSHQSPDLENSRDTDSTNSRDTDSTNSRDTDSTNSRDTKSIKSLKLETTKILQDPTKEKAIGIIGALKIPGVIEFSLCLFFAKMVSYVFLYQLPKFIHATSKMDAENSGFLSEMFDVGGIIGGISAGIITDLSGMSGTTCSAMLVIAIPLLFCYKTLVQSWCPIACDPLGAPLINSCYGGNIAMLMLVGLLVNGPYALITTAVSAELGNHRSLKGSNKALATVTAIIDGMGSIGAAVGPTIGSALSPASKEGSWDGFFFMLMAADLMALLMLIRIVNHEIYSFVKRRRRRY